MNLHASAKVDRMAGRIFLPSGLTLARLTPHRNHYANSPSQAPGTANAYLLRVYDVLRFAAKRLRAAPSRWSPPACPRIALSTSLLVGPHQPFSPKPTMSPPTKTLAKINLVTYPSNDPSLTSKTPVSLTGNQPQGSTMSHAHLVGINEASRLTGKNKATIAQANKAGKLAAVVDDNGRKRYDVSELERVYGTLRSPNTGYAPVETHRNQPAPTTDATGFSEVIKAKDELIETLRLQVQDLMLDRDHWRDHAKALPAPTNHTTPAPVDQPSPTTPAPVKRGFWPFRKRVTV